MSEGRYDDAKRQNANRALRRGIVWLGGIVVLMAAPMFLSAGGLGWVQGWFFLGTYIALTVAAVAYLWRTNPEVIVARSTFHWQGQPASQVAAGSLFFILYVAMFLVTGMDTGRFHWSHIPLWLVVLGISCS